MQAFSNDVITYGTIVGGYLYATCLRFKCCSHGVPLNGLEVTKECVETGGALNTIARDPLRVCSCGQVFEALKCCGSARSSVRRPRMADRNPYHYSRLVSDEGECHLGDFRVSFAVSSSFSLQFHACRCSVFGYD